MASADQQDEAFLTANDPLSQATTSAVVTSVTVAPPVPDTSDTSDLITPKPFTLDRRRFLVCFGVFLLIFGNNVLFGSYGAVTPTTAKRYNTSSWSINLLNVVNAAAAIPSTWPTTWLLDTHGIRPGAFVVVLGTVVGALFRWLSFASEQDSGKVAMLVVGSLLIGLVGPTAQDQSTKAAAHWFSGNGRLTANSLMGLGTPLGVAVGQFIGPLIVNSDPNNVDLLNLISLGIAAVCCVVGALLIQNTPATPPSASAQHGTVNYKEGLRQIGRNVPFWIVVFTGSVAIAVIGVMSTFASNYLTPYGYTEDLAGNLAIAMFVGGITMSIILSRILDYTKAHTTAMKVLTAMLVLGTSLFYYAVVATNQEILCYVSCTLVGMAAMPMVSLSMEIAAEATFPVPEATSSGTLILVSQTFIVIFIFVTNGLAESETGKMWRSLVFLITVSSVSLVASLFYRATNRRIELEKQHAMNLLVVGVPKDEE
ncbi:Major facilitator super domain-containing protein 7 [Rhizoclosmatium sp. JEL0117]|nr:Major facilitator super domain-containing protein 7 [Rhizoclosmatium sp. JEL0117]